MMRQFLRTVTALLAVSGFCAVDASAVDTPSSRQILPSAFKPPKVFKNTNLVRNINLEKGYVKESINVVIENIDSSPQSEYYIPFDPETIGKVGGLEVRDKKDASKPAFKVEVAEWEVESPTQFYRVTLLEPLKPKSQQTLSINYHILSSLAPLPATISQADKQYLLFKFSSYSPSAYDTAKQKTKIKFPTVEIPDYTSKPERQGSTYTYGPYDNVPAGAEQLESVRYEFTKPLIHATLLERDVEVSHWGGNAAFEERYWLTNQGANLSSQFSRLQWQQTAYFRPATSAITALKVPLSGGSKDAYFTDEIGNISTSNFRTSDKEAYLELKPRYPIFGGWNFPFRIGWNGDLKNYLRKAVGDTFVLNVPFIDGPKMPEGASYAKVNVRIILPEGAINVKWQTAVPLVGTDISLHKTFLDTVGRTALTLSASNVIDEARDQPIVVTYEYPFMAGLRKPLTIFAAFMSLFVGVWLVGSLNVSIGRKKQ